MRIRAIINYHCKPYYNGHPGLQQFVCYLQSWKNGRIWWKIDFEASTDYIGMGKFNPIPDDVNIFLDSKLHKLKLFGGCFFHFKEWHLTENDPNI